MSPRILWIDDEISSLKSLIFYLNEEGYEVDTVSNGSDAIHMIMENNYDAVFLDEYMPGLDGIETLNQIRAYSYNIPIVMITKSEENHIIDEALAERVDEFLIKPVNPKQLIAVLKKLLISKQKIRMVTGKNYSQTINRINDMLNRELDYETFYNIHHILSLWNLAINRNLEKDIIEVHNLQKEQLNRDFSKFIFNNYPEWLKHNNGPVLSHNLFKEFIIDDLKSNNKVFFLLIDCLRYDHYLLIETFLKDYFKIKLNYYYSIIPTATPYSRNAIFSGLLPSIMYKIYPDKWDFYDTSSQNQYENFFLRKQLEKYGINNIHYAKISTNEELKRYIDNFNNLKNNILNALVINIMDIFTHFRSESSILKDMLPDENSLLAFVSTWFRTSDLLDFFSYLIEEGYKIIITSDHGSIISLKPLKIETGRDVSLNLKYKFGSSIKRINNEILVINNPLKYGLCTPKTTDKWYLTTGNGYLVYSTKFNEYKKKYYGTFQHGGISMEEMIMPIGIVEGKNE